jgi:hypothetical protein
MVYAALVFGDADHPAPARSFRSGNYSCSPDGLRFPRAGPAQSRNSWVESQRARYLSIGLLLAGIWLLLLCGSQLTQIISDRHNFRDLSLIRGDDRWVLLRPALFTQTLSAKHQLARARGGQLLPEFEVPRAPELKDLLEGLALRQITNHVGQTTIVQRVLTVPVFASGPVANATLALPIRIRSGVSWAEAGSFSLQFTRGRVTVRSVVRTSFSKSLFSSRRLCDHEPCRFFTFTSSACGLFLSICCPFV